MLGHRISNQRLRDMTFFPTTSEAMGESRNAEKSHVKNCPKYTDGFLFGAHSEALVCSRHPHTCFLPRHPHTFAVPRSAQTIFAPTNAAKITWEKMCARHLKGGLLSTNVATSSKDSCFDHLLGPARATRAAALARAETIIVLRNAETNLLWQSCKQVIQGRFVFEAHAASCVCHRHLRTLFLARHPDNIVVPSSAVRIFVPRNVEEIIIAQNVLKTSGGIPVAKTL